MKYLFPLLFCTSLLSCNYSKKKNICAKIQDNDQKKVRYTFSQSEIVDFGVSSGLYQILYDYSNPLDTFYNRAYVIGKDSIVYLQLGFFKNTDEYRDFAHQGDKKQLILFDGITKHSLSLPLFDTHMSNFSINDHIIYYWGLKDYKTYACYYDLNTNKHQSIYLGPSPETDFDGIFGAPIVEKNNQVIFKLYDLVESTWHVNDTCTKIFIFTEPMRHRLHLYENDNINKETNHENI